jgi:hypothetical protein
MRPAQPATDEIDDGVWIRLSDVILGVAVALMLLLGTCG